MSGYISQSSVESDLEEEPNGIEYLKRVLPSKRNFGVLYDLYATNHVRFPITLSFEKDEKVMKPRPVTKKMLEQYYDTYSTSESTKVYNKLVSGLDGQLKEMSTAELSAKRLARKQRQKAKSDRRLKVEELKWQAEKEKLQAERAQVAAELQELKAGLQRKKKKARLPTVVEENEDNVG